MANFNSWTALFTFLGFVLILAGTSMDSYLRNSLRNTGDDSTFNMAAWLTWSGDDFYYFYEQSQQSFGSLGARFSQTHGFSYKYICPTKGNGHYYDHRNHSSPNHGHTAPGGPHTENEGTRAKSLNRISAGMIALLLLSVFVGFVASLRTILSVTNSSITADLTGAKTWAVAAFLFVLVTWALWLRAQYEYLRPNNHIEADCRFHSIDSVRNNPELADASYIGVYSGASFGLAVVSSFAYLLLFVNIGRATAGTAPAGAAAPSASKNTLIQWATIGFVAIFVAAALNSWSHAGFSKYNEACSTQFSNAAQEALYGSEIATPREDPRNGFDVLNYRQGRNGNAQCTYSNAFGVFTAFETVQVSLTYQNEANRAFLCVGSDLEKDDAGEGLVQGGRVTLGFAIAATILSFVSGVVGTSNPVQTFWINVVALSCVVVSLLVWGITADYVLSGRCCQSCVMGPSVGLLASGGIFLLFAIFYQAWVVADEVYVLPAHAYGMAAKAEADSA